jgi:hypothetical protein
MSTTAIATIGYFSSVIIFVIVFSIIFPWRLKANLEAIKAGVKPVGNEPEPMDMEEAIYQLFRFRLILAVLLLVFCIFVALCSTIILVAGTPVIAMEKKVEASSQNDAKKTDTNIPPKDAQPDQGHEDFTAKASTPKAPSTREAPRFEKRDPTSGSHPIESLPPVSTPSAPPPPPKN